MKLGEALSLLKKEQSRLSRLISLRKENVYVEEGKKSSFDLKELSNEIEKKIDDIRKLKVKIQKINLNTKIIEENINLAEAIIKVNDLRNKIKSLSQLFESKRSYFRDKDEKNMVAQLDEFEIENEIEELEMEKVKLDNKIQMTNWATQIND